MTDNQLRLIERRANKQLPNTAHWFLWESELRATGLKARLGVKLSDFTTGVQVGLDLIRSVRNGNR